MAIESVGGSSYQFSALRVDPHPGLESKFQKYRREHDLAAKQEEQGKFQYQTSKALEEAQSVAQAAAESGDKYTAAAKAQNTFQSYMSTALTFEIARTTQEHVDDLHTQLQQNANAGPAGGPGRINRIV